MKIARVLFLCTANSARSQMAEGLANYFLKSSVKAYSAGVAPSRVNPYAIQAMKEIGIDISSHRSKHVDEFQGELFDAVITLCDEAAKACPTFSGAKQVIHVPYPDPATVGGRDEEILDAFRDVRDRIRNELLPQVETMIQEKA